MEQQRFLYGTVIKLTREDTLEDIEKNFVQMRENGLDTVVVWPSAFWWEEKKEGYPFNTGKVLLQIAERVGLGIIMELAGQLPMMEYIPDFQMKDDYYAVDEKGNKKLKPASFGYLNYFHPEVDALICAHYEKTALAYRDFPALIGYDIFNETMFASYDEHTLGRFRLWLQKKYKTIEELNAVWERTYTDFSQVAYAPWMWMSIAPAADWGAFRKASTGIYLKNWCDAIRKVDDKHPLIADNIGSMITNGTGTYERPQDDYALKETVDEIGMSFYPKGVAGCKTPYTRWTTFDAFFSASKREGFYISEMQTHIQALFNPTTCVRPYELKQWCYEALAGGAKGLIYWMWRPFTKGLQTAGRGLVDYKNRSTPRLAFAKAFSEAVEGIGALKPIRSKVGILFDGQCHDFQVCYTRCYKVDQNLYMNSLCGAYQAMWDAGVRCDIVKLEEIKEYKMLILSNHIVIGEDTAEILTEYVRAGGIIVCDGKIGIVNERTMLNDVLPGGAFNKAMGCEFIDTDYEGLDFTCHDKSYNGFYGRELVEVTEGRVIGTFADGSPAVVEKVSGRGKVITVNTYLWYGHNRQCGNADAFAAALADAYDLRDVTVTAPLKIRISENKNARFVFVFNYTDEPVSGEIMGSGFDGPVTVGAQDVVVLKKERT
ncbi:MAG: beta-galactosidase [Clostridia bacterium]|nr:beta-galactosidase [Clostridia bacterium]